MLRKICITLLFLLMPLSTFAAGTPLRFFLYGYGFKVVNNANGVCVSQIIEYRGPDLPDDWGNGKGNGEVAKSIIERYFDRYKRACQEKGFEDTQRGYVGYDHNQYGDKELDGKYEFQTKGRWVVRVTVM